MPARVKVRAAIWLGEQLVVNRVTQHGQVRVTLPGGRVGERESLTDALHREVLEETGLEIKIGDLLLAAEVFSGPRIQDVELIFDAAPLAEIDGAQVSLIDPDLLDDSVLPPIVLPPVLADLARIRRGEPTPRWLGNLYLSRVGVTLGAAGA